MSDTYYRPVQRQQTEIMIDKSRFITTVVQVTTVKQARDFIKRIRGEMPDASHHVYAFRVGYGNSVIEGMSDDGEPSGTAGPPTLAVLRGQDTGDIALVTTRYFGGIKLGTGGLVRAYTQAAQQMLDRLKLALKIPEIKIGFDIEYTYSETASRLIKAYQGHINDEIFAGNVTLIATLPLEERGKFESELQELTHGQTDIVVLEVMP